MIRRSPITLAAAAVALVLAACAEPSAPNAVLAPDAPSLTLGTSNTAWVTNNNDQGPGSLRAAVGAANGNAGITRIDIAFHVSTIALTQPLVFTGSQPLVINAGRAVIDGAGLPAGSAGFRATGGGDLSVLGLGVRRAPAEGIVVAVPGTATGTVKVKLVNVAVENNGSHGILINDQAEFFNDPESTSPLGSAASLDVQLVAVRSLNNGFTALDQDGIRINEGGEGTLKASISLANVTGNGGDGIELDERATGDASFSLIGSTLLRNGGYDAADFDDGIDVDEAGDGSILGSISFSKISENFEQGVDLNENDLGDLKVDMTLVEASDNKEEGIEYEEDDDVAGGGDIVATLIAVKTHRNGALDGDAGLKLREKGTGDLNVKLIGVESSNNFVDGIFLREDAAGTLNGTLQSTKTLSNAGDGIDFDENSTGDLVGVVENSTSSMNTSAGVRGDQQTTGIGSLMLKALTATGNGAGVFVVNSGITVTQTP